MSMSLTTEILQIAGSLAILGAFLATQLRGLRPTSPSYLVPNLLGSTVLAIQAGVASQWGFLLLEGSWSLVSAAGLAQLLRRRVLKRSVTD
jgi:hypothetical protein